MTASYYDVYFSQCIIVWLRDAFSSFTLIPKGLFDLGNIISHGFLKKIRLHITTNGFASIASILNEVAFDTKLHLSNSIKQNCAVTFD